MKDNKATIELDVHPSKSHPGYTNFTFSFFVPAGAKDVRDIDKRLYELFKKLNDGADLPIQTVIRNSAELDNEGGRLYVVIFVL